MNSPKQRKVKKLNLIDKLSNDMDDPESEMLSGKYYEPNEMTTILKNTNIFPSFT